MRKGLLILGILLLIGGLIGLAISGIAYGNYSYIHHQIASLTHLTNVQREQLALANVHLEDAIFGIVGGIIFVAIGLVLIIVAFKGKSKKERLVEHGQNKT